MSFRRRPAANVAAIVLAGLLGLTACNSQPGNRRVVLDMIDALDLPADQDQCMRDTVENGYSDNDLEQIAEQNEELNFNDDEFVAAGTEQFQQFVADLAACIDGSAASSEAIESTERSSGTDTTEGVDSAETTAS